jgi:hypothetical protein
MLPSEVEAHLQDEADLFEVAHGIIVAGADARYERFRRPGASVDYKALRDYVRPRLAGDDHGDARILNERLVHVVANLLAHAMCVQYEASARHAWPTRS